MCTDLIIFVVKCKEIIGAVKLELVLEIKNIHIFLFALFLGQNKLTTATSWQVKEVSCNFVF